LVLLYDYITKHDPQNFKFVQIPVKGLHLTEVVLFNLPWNFFFLFHNAKEYVGFL